MLSKLLQRGEESGMISGFTVCNGGIGISHLQFADDILIFVDASEEQIMNLRHILMIFEASTGVKVEYLPISYLGLPLGAKPRATSVWNTILERMEKKLAMWRRNFLSKGGRLVLIKSSLASLPVYFLSLFLIPANIELKLRRLMRKFLWGTKENKNKMSWVAWKKICRGKNQGGLGVRDLKKTNTVLLLKWVWRYGSEQSALLRKVINEKYGGHPQALFPSASTQTYGVGVWRSILKGRDFIMKNTELKVRNGKKKLFWGDSWCGQLPLNQSFPELYKLSRLKMGTIAKMVTESPNGRGWNFRFRRHLKEEEVNMVITLLQTLGDPPILDTYDDDESKCVFAEANTFSSKQYYEALLPPTSTNFPVKLVWIN